MIKIKNGLSELNNSSYHVTKIRWLKVWEHSVHFHLEKQPKHNKHLRACHLLILCPYCTNFMRMFTEKQQHMDLDNMKVIKWQNWVKYSFKLIHETLHETWLRSELMHHSVVTPLYLLVKWATGRPAARLRTGSRRCQGWAVWSCQSNVRAGWAAGRRGRRSDPDEDRSPLTEAAEERRSLHSHQLLYPHHTHTHNALQKYSDIPVKRAVHDLERSTLPRSQSADTTEEPCGTNTLNWETNTWTN